MSKTHKCYKLRLPFGWKIGFHWRLMAPGYFQWFHPKSYVFYHGWKVIDLEEIAYDHYKVNMGWRVKVLWVHVGRQKIDKVYLE